MSASRGRTRLAKKVSKVPLLSTLRERLFPDRWSLFLWPCALAWMCIIGYRGWEMAQIGVRGGILGGILMLFAPLPIVLLATRPRPDREREDVLAQRRRSRLAKRQANLRD